MRNRPWVDIGGRPVGYFFAAVALLLIMLAAHLYRSDARLAADGVEAQGTVVDFRKARVTRRADQRTGNTPERFETLSEPVIRFKTADERTIEFVALSGSYPDDLDKGDTLTVLYLSADPQTAEIKGSTRLSDGWVWVSVLAAACLVPGLYLVVWPAVMQRRQRARLARWPQRLRRIEADVVEVRRLLRRADGRYTFDVAAQWRDPATGKVHRFDSGTMGFDPAVYASIRQPKEWDADSEEHVRQALRSARLLVRVHPDDPSQGETELLRIPGIGPAERPSRLP